jgi:hypothetical protein
LANQIAGSDDLSPCRASASTASPHQRAPIGGGGVERGERFLRPEAAEANAAGPPDVNVAVPDGGHQHIQRRPVLEVRERPRQGERRLHAIAPQLRAQ